MNWIKKTEKLPSNGEYVLVYLHEELNSQMIHLTMYSNKYGFESVSERLVSHWRPLPENP